QFEESMTVVDLDIRPAYRKRLLDPRGHSGSRMLAEVDVLGKGTGPEGGDGTNGETRQGGRSLQLARNLSAVEEVYRALVLATRDYVEKGNFEGVLVALSGGIDSALVATVAVDALGPDRVHGALMPSRFSSDHSVADAETLVRHLGIEARTIGIEPAHAAFISMLEPSFAGQDAGLAEENLQARIRGNLVMALSNQFRWLVLTTGNKSEMAVGYATLYGDMAGGFAVIKDVPKTLVYELCRWRNAAAGTDLVPENILDKPPSAELRPDQRDDDNLPPYDVLDPILQGYVELDMTIAELVDDGFDEGVVRRVVELVDRAEYKRRQAAPGPRVTTRAFGKDRRMPITNGFRHDRRPPASTRDLSQ
ncbi:MAG: NAD(+) synthase, partial [Acidimicrobiales bacterium]